MIRAPYLLERLHLVHSKLQNVVEYSLPDGVVMARVLELRFVTPNPIVIAKVLKSSKRPWFGDSNTIQPERRKPGFPGRRYPSASQQPSNKASCCASGRSKSHE